MKLPDDFVKDLKKKYLTMSNNSKDVSSMYKWIASIVFAQKDLAYIIQFGDRGQVALTSYKDRNQPVIYYAGATENPGKGCIMVDKDIFMDIKINDPIHVLLSLYSAYYILDIEYPRPAKKLYLLLEYFLFGGEKQPEGAHKLKLAY